MQNFDDALIASFSIEGLEFGVYNSSVKDEEGNLQKRGFSIMPKKSAATEMQGYYDPDQSERIDFSAPRDAAVAIAGGALPQDELTEEQRELARHVKKAMQGNLSNILSDRNLVGSIDISPTNPTAYLPTAYDKQASIAVHCTYAAGNNSLDAKTLGEIISAAISKVKRSFSDAELTLVPEVDEKKITPPEKKKQWGNASLKASGNLRQKENASISNENISEILGSLAISLNKNFPKDSNTNKREAVFQDVRNAIVQINKKANETELS